MHFYMGEARFIPWWVKRTFSRVASPPGPQIERQSGTAFFHSWGIYVLSSLALFSNIWLCAGKKSATAAGNQGIWWWLESLEQSSVKKTSRSWYWELILGWALNQCNPWRQWIIWLFRCPQSCIKGIKGPYSCWQEIGILSVEEGCMLATGAWQCLISKQVYHVSERWCPCHTSWIPVSLMVGVVNVQWWKRTLQVPRGIFQLVPGTWSLVFILGFPGNVCLWAPRLQKEQGPHSIPLEGRVTGKLLAWKHEEFCGVFIHGIGGHAQKRNLGGVGL